MQLCTRTRRCIRFSNANRQIHCRAPMISANFDATANLEQHAFRIGIYMFYLFFCMSECCVQASFTLI